MTANDNKELPIEQNTDQSMNAEKLSAASEQADRSEPAVRPEPAAATDAEASKSPDEAKKPAEPPGAAKQNDQKEPKVRWYQRTFVRKLRYALLALVISLTLWGYVLMRENPARTKRVENVHLAFESGTEADLLVRRNLVVSRDSSSALQSVAVNVRTTLNELPRFNNAAGEIVTATISLSGIDAPGEYERRITATSTIGTVDSVEPEYVTITVERSETRSIPVRCSFTGSLPNGYWRDEPQLEIGSISISGAKRAIDSVSHASCTIDLTGRTESVNESFELVLLDGKQQPVESSDISSYTRYVTVRMRILPRLDVDVSSLLTGVGQLDEHYELAEFSISPTHLSIAAPQSVLDQLADQLVLEPVNLSELTLGAATLPRTLIGIPTDNPDLHLLSDNSFIVTIEVKDKITERSFTIDLAESDVLGLLPDRFSYSFSTLSFTVKLSGPARIIETLNDSSISLVLDVGSFNQTGTHLVRPVLKVAGEPEWLTDGTVTTDIGTTVMTIAPKEP